MLFAFNKCDDGPKDMRLLFSSNDVNVVGKHSYLVKKNGPISQSVTNNSSILKEPERGVTRLIVRNTKLPSYNSDFIFDIQISSSIDIKGVGQYHFAKQPKSNVWLLEINGDEVNTLSIVEGPPTASDNYGGMGIILMILGILLIIAGFPTILAGGLGCLLIPIGLILLGIGYNLTQPV